MSASRSIFYTFLTQIPTLILGVVTGIIISNILGPDGKGDNTIFISDIDLFTIFLSFSYSYAVIYFVANGKIAAEKLLGIGLSVVCLGTLLLGIFLAVLYLFFEGGFAIPKGYNSPFYAVYLLAAFFLTLVNGLISAFFQGKTLFRYVNQAALINSLLNICAFGILLLLHKYYHKHFIVRDVLVISLGVLLLNTAVWLWFYSLRIKLRPSFRFTFDKEVKQIFIFSGVNHLAHIINFLNYNLDFYIVHHILGSKQLGYYSLAVGLSRMAWMITNPITMVLVPHLTRISSNAERKAMFAFFSRLNVTLVLLFMGGGLLLAGFVIPLVFPDYTASVWPFRLLLFGIIFSCMAKVFSLYPYALNKVKYNVIANAAGVAVTIALDLLLIPRIGIEGACIATNLSYFSIFAVTCYFVFVKLKLPRDNYFLLTAADIRSKGKWQNTIVQDESTVNDHAA